MSDDECCDCEPAVPVERLRAMIRQLGDELTPTARRMLQRLADEHDQLPEVVEFTEMGPSKQEIAGEVPYVAVGASERAPWADLPLHCPTCGEGPLVLQESTGSGMSGTGIVLRYISHCGRSWLRGDIDQA